MSLSNIPLGGRILAFESLTSVAVAVAVVVMAGRTFYFCRGYCCFVVVCVVECGLSLCRLYRVRVAR